MAKQAFDFNSKFADLEKIKKDDAAKEQGTMAAIASTIKVVGNPFEDEETSKPQETVKPKEEKKHIEKKKQETVKTKPEPVEEDTDDKPLARVDQIFSKNLTKPVKITSFSLDADVLQAVEKLAKKNNISKSKVVNEILKNVLM